MREMGEMEDLGFGGNGDLGLKREEKLMGKRRSVRKGETRRREKGWGLRKKGETMGKGELS